MDINPLTISLPLLATNNSSAKGLELQLNQVLRSKVIEVQAVLDTFKLQVGDKALTLQASQPLQLIAGQSLEIQVSKLLPAPEFTVLTPTANRDNQAVVILKTVNSPAQPATPVTDSPATGHIKPAATNNIATTTNPPQNPGSFSATVIGVTAHKLVILPNSPLPAQLTPPLPSRVDNTNTPATSAPATQTTPTGIPATPISIDLKQLWVAVPGETPDIQPQTVTTTNNQTNQTEPTPESPSALQIGKTISLSLEARQTETTIPINLSSTQPGTANPANLANSQTSTANPANLSGGQPSISAPINLAEAQPDTTSSTNLAGAQTNGSTRIKLAEPQPGTLPPPNLAGAQTSSASPTILTGTPPGSSASINLTGTQADHLIPLNTAPPQAGTSAPNSSSSAPPTTPGQANVATPQTSIGSQATLTPPPASLLPLKNAPDLVLRPQMNIELQLLSSGPTPTFLVTPAAVDVQQLIMTTHKELLPIQLPLQPLIQHLQQLSSAENLSANSPGETLQLLAKAILHSLPEQHTLTLASNLKALVDDSGLFLESKLQTLSKPQLTGKVVVEPLLEQDMKFKLGKLTDSIQRLLHQSAATEIPVAELDLLKQSLDKLHGALAKQTLDQLNSLPKDDGSRSCWHIELVFRNAQNVDSVQIEIDQNASNHSESKPKHWAVSITITPPELGTIHCRLSCYDGSINTRFWSESTATVDKINAHLDYLKQQFANQGLSAGFMEAHQGKPVVNDKPRQPPATLLSVKA